MNWHANRFLTVVVFAMGVSLSTFQGAAQDLQRITMQFTLTTDDPLAPSIPITGTIVHTAPSSLDPIQSFESIDMTIAGHTYSVRDIGYIYYAPDWFLIGGLAHGAGAIYNDFTDDFYLNWNPVSSTPIRFQYGTSQYGGIWPRIVGPGVPYTEAFTLFTINAEPVPETSTPTLLLLGVAIGLLRLRTSGCTERRDCVSVSFRASMARRR
jgi:hypothetical protein